MYYKFYININIKIFIVILIIYKKVYNFNILIIFMYKS